MCERDSQVLPLIRGSDSEIFIEYFGWSTTHARGGGGRVCYKDVDDVLLALVR